MFTPLLIILERARVHMSDLYSWFKAIHLIAVIFWMAGLLYLPRLFVYHHQSKVGGELEIKMIEAEAKLIKIIMTPAMLIAFVFGLVLIGYNIPNLTATFWLPIKLLFAINLIGYHGFLSKQRKLFLTDTRPKSESFFRKINEIPAIITIIIIIMVIVRPI